MHTTKQKTINVKDSMVITVLLILLLAGLFFSAGEVFAAEQVASGSAGQKVSWTLDSDGVLTFTGSGTITSNTWSSYNALITEIEFQSGITGIEGSRLFANMPQLATIRWPNTLTYVYGGSGVFYDLPAVSEFYFDGTIEEWLSLDWYKGGEFNCPCYYSENGVDLYINSEKLVDVTIPKGISSIKTFAFSSCKSIETISFEEESVEIKAYAFNKCKNLKCVNGSERIHSLEYGAFMNCTSLESMDISNVTEIPNLAFMGAGISEVQISEECVSIGNWAFMGCKSLQTFTIPATVAQLGDSVFSGCEQLKTVDIQSNLITNLPEYTFFGCHNLTNVTIPSSITSMGKGVFRDCNSLKTVSLPEGIKSISMELFSGCSSLTSIAIPEGVTNIGDYAFYGCSDLTSITIPETVTDIGNYVFHECSSLTSIVIPQNVTSLSGGIFYGCSSLTSITLPFVGSRNDSEGYQALLGHVFGTNEYEGSTRVNQQYDSDLAHHYTYYVPESLEEVIITGGSIQLGAFSGCSNLKRITIPENVTSIGDYAFYNCNSLTNILIPDGITNIGDYAFCNCNSLTSILIPDGVPNIGDYVFHNCNGLTNITIPESVASIEDHAFHNCIGLKSIDIPESVTSIGDYAFYNCSGLTNITIPGRITSIEDFTFANCSGLTSITISEGVTSIKDYAFLGCSGLTNITIPESVTSIGVSVFTDCNGLTSIVIPQSVTSIGCQTFSNCSGLASITIPDGVTSIESNTFYGCSSLTSVTIPESVTSIGYNAFYDCSSLTSVTIPESVASIGDHAFYNCSGLKSVTIPAGVTSIENNTFYNCSGLTDITISNGVTSIGYGAFSGCSGLTTIMIPESVTSIDEFAFCNCSNLQTIYIPGSVVSVGYRAFYQTGIQNVYTTPGSYASTLFSYYQVKYLCEPADNEVEHFLRFKTDSIVMKESSTITLAQYLLTDLDESEYTIELSDESLFMHDSGEIASLGPGECDITVKYGDQTVTAKLIAQDGDFANTETISFKDSEITLTKGNSTVNTVRLTPSNADISDIEWSTSDDSIVTVNNGVIKAVGAGTATVSAYSKTDNSIKAECEVTVTVPLHDLILIGDTPVLLDKGASKKVSYYKYPSDATNVEVSFTSSDPSVVEIDETGKMTAKNFGAADITVAAGDITKTMQVKVYRPLAGITLDPKSAQVKAKESLQLNVIYEPEDTTERDVVWTSNKESVATVDENGLVTAHGKGIATITATAGDYAATCTIVCPNVPMTGIQLPDAVELKYGQSTAQELTFIPVTTTDDKNATWASSDTSIFTVSSDGVITPTGLGTATLTATVGEYSATSEITVVKGLPAFATPEGITATCNQPLSEVALPEGFTWADASQSAGASGSKVFAATFTPADQDHYVTVSDVMVPVSVEHSYAEEWSKNEEAHWHECACGDKHEEAEHTYGDWIETTAPTCTEAGEKERTCAVCGYVENGVVEPTDHDWFADYTVDAEATCTEAGSKSIHCKTCNEIKPESQTEIPALGHSYAETVIAPTCSQGGYTLHVCGRCGDSYQDNETAATGHDFGEWVIDTDSSCTAEGIQHRECKTCGYTETKGVDKKEHAFAGEYTVDKAATCTTDGSKSYHCTNGGCTAITGSVVIPAEGHHFSEWEVKTEATCTEAGELYHKCDVCETEETMALPPTGHQWLDKEIVDKDATCTEAGSKSIHCKVCDEVKPDSQVAIPAKGHSYGSWEVTKEPTCTEDGEKQRVCATCGDVEKAPIAATGHKWADIEVVDENATCTEAGSKSIHCKVCDEVKPDSQVAIPAKGHIYGSWEVTKEPTCTEDGEKQRACATCGDVEKAPIAATGHKWADKKTIDKEATCTEAGEKSNHCVVCDAVNPESVTTIEPLGHAYSDSIVAPTCSQDGYTYHVCARCNDSYTDNETPATGHVFGDWSVDKDSTCTAEGSQHRECSVCGYAETKGINKKDHSFSKEYTVDKEATCTTDGSKSYHCTAEGCSAVTGSVVIPATGHQYTEWKETKKPTCTEDGDAERTCQVCGEKETIHFEAREHIWMKEASVDQYPTCTNEGSKSIHCAVCGASKEGTSEAIPCIAHAWDRGVVTTAATYDKDGVKTYTCSACGKTRTEKIAKLPKTQISEANVQGIATKVYSGSSVLQGLTVTAKGKTLTNGTDYTVSYANNKNIGTATITVTGIKGYTGTIKKTFAIKGDLSKAVTKVSVGKIADKTYSGSAITPSLTVKAVGSSGSVVTLKKDTDYKLSYSKNKSVGKATVTITGIGKYTGTKKVTFKINPKGTSLSKVTAASKGFTVQWKKQGAKMSSSTITGYEIQYSTSSTFKSGNKTVTVKGASKESKKITGLKGGKKYYVRVRTYKTVNGVKYCSKWSAKKYVTTKK